MMSFTRRIMVACILILCYQSTCAAQKPISSHDFTLSLKPVDVHIKKGNTPKFQLTLTNVSNQACKILNVEHRSDLQNTYYKLVITKDGWPVDIPEAISDPGPISDSDWIEVSPGGKKEFLFTSFPLDFQELQPRIYKAYIIFWRDPYQSHLTAYESSLAEFTITQ